MTLPTNLSSSWWIFLCCPWPMLQTEAQAASADAALQRQLRHAALLCARKLLLSPALPEELASGLGHHVGLLMHSIPQDDADAATVERMDREAAAMSSQHRVVAAAAARRVQALRDGAVLQ